MTDTVKIDKRFCGPPTSGNGGYSCGLIANQIGNCAKVRLHAPPPLDEPLHFEKNGDAVELKQGQTLLGSGIAYDFELEVPPTPSYENAKAAEARYVGFESHIFPCCFVCGPDREADDGLRLFPGPVDPENWSLLACTCQPSSNLLDDSGNIRHEFIWSVLDCPSYFGVMGNVQKTALLGELELKIVNDAKGDIPLIVWCWPISSEGRKHCGGSAVATADGELIAYAKGTWIELKSQ
jgi:hypothetical protein